MCLAIEINVCKRDCYVVCEPNLSEEEMDQALGLIPLDKKLNISYYDGYNQGRGE